LLNKLFKKKCPKKSIESRRVAAVASEANEAAIRQRRPWPSLRRRRQRRSLKNPKVNHQKNQPQNQTKPLQYQLRKTISPLPLRSTHNHKI